MKKMVRKLRVPTKKIVGHRGQWTADVEGRELAVLHSSYREGTTGYFAPPKESRSGAKFDRLRLALENNDVAVMQRDASEGDGSREGYIGLFSYKDLEFGDGNSIRLTLVERIQ